MAEAFKPINSQEEFDELIKSRLEREANKVRGEFADYSAIKASLEAKTKEVEETNGKLSGLQQQVDELNKKLKATETDSVKTRIAYEMKLPQELRDRLVGTTEAEIRKDAEGLAKLISKQPPAPLFNPETPPAKDTSDAAYKALAKELTKIGE